ncbi:MAG TPA: amidohydrolase [Vicinamibacterales bacterium]|jgi:hypothetical protein
MHEALFRAVRVAGVTLAACAVMAMAGCGGSQPAAADLIITNASIWTGNPKQPQAEALAIRGDRIAAVGRAADVKAWRGPHTTIIDADHRGVLPGFNDAHVRLLDGAEQLGHTNADTRPLTAATRLRMVRQALQYAASLGVTSLQDMSPDDETLAAYQELADEGALTARIYVAPIETSWRDQAKLGIRRAFGSPVLRLGAINGLADGSLAGHTAYFFQPYADLPNDRGRLSEEMQPLSSIESRLTEADAAGLQICMDAVGDQAISLVLDIYQHIEDANGTRDRRLRIERAQTVAADAFDRFAKLGVIASVQPYHAVADGPLAEERLGPDRASRSYAYKSFLDHHVTLAFGSDWPAEPLDPLQTIDAAVTRRTIDGKHPDGWMPAQRISMADAVRAYTAGSADAEFRDRDLGTLEPGKLADVVILNKDIFGFEISVAPASIKDVHVDTTIMGGRVVYHR